MFTKKRILFFVDIFSFSSTAPSSLRLWAVVFFFYLFKKTFIQKWKTKERKEVFLCLCVCVCVLGGTFVFLQSVTTFARQKITQEQHEKWGLRKQMLPMKRWSGQKLHFPAK